MPHEFGRILLHISQRRGALGVTTDPDDAEEGKVKEAIDHTREEMAKRNVTTFGQLIADLMDERKNTIKGRPSKHYQDPVRNRRDQFEFHADRGLVRKEFATLWESQSAFDGELASLLTDNLRSALDNSTETDKW